MKLCNLGESIGRIVSKEEIDLERKVLSVQLIVKIEGPNGQIAVHSWDYLAKREPINET